MTLVDHPLGKNWLAQFDSPDQALASFFLRSLRLVSFSELEGSLKRRLIQLMSESDNHLALFPIEEPVSTSGAPHYGSSQRIGHMLKGLVRERPTLQLAPSIPEMRRSRIKNIVLVDDFVGSGRRSLNHWKNLDTTVKSWLSYGVCKLWLVAFAAHPFGIRVVSRNIGPLKRNALLSVLQLSVRPKIWGDEIHRLCLKYGARTSRPDSALGVGQCMAPLVFQHGCPNNTPAILWRHGRAWRALFPERAIPDTMFDCFTTEATRATHPDALASVNQYRLGLMMLERVRERRQNNVDMKLLTMLGLLLKGVGVGRLSRMMMEGADKVDELLGKAKTYCLLDNRNRVTEFGLDIVNRYRHERTVGQALPDRLDPYFPVQFSPDR
jgi:hypothetical protein